MGAIEGVEDVEGLDAINALIVYAEQMQIPIPHADL